jgi:hypothetical protein
LDIRESVAIDRTWTLSCDFVAIAALFILSISLLFRHASTLGLSHDGFLLTYASFQGDLQAINFTDIKEPGRPFVGLAIKLAELTTGGSVTGINLFMYASYTASALLIYALMRLLIPGQPIWAVVAATLKLTWSSNVEIFDNSGIIIYFGEAVFWLATVQFVSFFRRPSPLTATTMVACVATVCGTYQGLWPLIALAPVCLIATQSLPWRTKNARLALFFWSVGAIPVMVWSFISAQQYITEISPSPLTMLGRITDGAWNAIGVSLLNPFISIVRMPPVPVDYVRDVCMAIMVAVWIWAATWRSAEHLEASGVRRKAISMIVLGLIAVVGTLAATTVKFDPVYTSRFMALPASGVLLMLGGISALVWSYAGRIGTVVVLVCLATFAIASARQLSAIGFNTSKAGFIERRFWEDFTVELPRIDEGTVVVFENAPPRGVATFDWYSTRIMRTLSETHLTFFSGETPAVHTNDGWRITTNIDLSQIAPEHFRGNWRSYSSTIVGSAVLSATYYDRSPPRLSRVKEYIVPEERVVALKWDAQRLRLWVDRDRSNLNRVHPDIPSTYGHRLFPATEIARDRRRAEQESGR